MTMQIRLFQTSDRELILSLAARLSECDLPAWRESNQIDQVNRAKLEKAMDQPELDSAIFVAKDNTGHLAGFCHIQTRLDFYTREKQGYISELAVGKPFEGQGVGNLLLSTAENW